MNDTACMVEHRLGPLAQIPLGEGREFRVGARRVAVFRPRGGEVAATQAECPHRAGPLADGTVGLNSVICPLHVRRFSLADGAESCGEEGLMVFPVRVDAAGDLMISLPEAGS